MSSNDRWLIISDFELAAADCRMRARYATEDGRHREARSLRNAALFYSAQADLARAAGDATVNPCDQIEVIWEGM